MTVDLAVVIGNMLARCVLTALAYGIVHYYFDRLNAAQRYGLGMICGSSFLTAPILYAVYIGDKRETPFDIWAPALLTTGMILFMAGCFVRFRRHQRANDAQVNYHAEWRKERGL